MKKNNSKITLEYKKKRNICLITSIITWFGLCGFLVIYGLCNAFQLNAETESVGKQLLDIFLPLVVSYGIALILVCFIREKMRNTIWLINIVLSSALLGKTFMYIAIGIFAIDEFVLNPLYKYFANKVSINVELDKRNV